MSTPETQQAYAQGYHVGYQHGQQAGGGSGGGSDYPVDLLARYPERSSRLLMFFLFFKPVLLIPHLIVLWVLSLGVSLVMIVAWFAVVITGNYPRSLWEFMVGFSRWNIRIQAWMLGLTDQYPPVSFK
ncbi:MAG: DUF4389 domain-containing protein [Bacillota bacterium]